VTITRRDPLLAWALATAFALLGANRVASQEPLLKKLSLKSTQLWLQQSDDGPVWKVRLWAQKRQHPAEMADIGDVYVSTKTAKVVRNDLHIERVN
jgi:hypothetical protein